MNTEELPTPAADESAELDPRFDRIVWVDLEMTGLNPRKNVILEIAVVVTDAELNLLGEGLDLVVHATSKQLDGMNAFVRKMHTTNGLIDQVKASKLSLADAEKQVVEYVRKHVDSKHRVPLAGNSIGTDRNFIRAYMPDFEAALHYRMIDVSSLKELARRWFPRVYYNKPPKVASHRALADIVGSIQELDYYRRAMLTANPGATSEECEQHAKDTMARYSHVTGTF